MLNFISPGAIIIAVISLAILILWERPFIKKYSFTKVIQGQLVAVLVGIGLHLWFKNIPGLVLDKEHIVSIPIAESAPDFFKQFTLPDFSAIVNPEIWVVAITLAIVASLETLLSVEAIDKLDPHKRITPTNRELKAQGIGNMISGLIGGLPVTQVIVRSSANVQSGGVTKMSAILHGILMLMCIILIPRFLNLIPLASLAAILIVVGYKLAKPSLFKSMYKEGWFQFLPFFITVVVIVRTDLLMGIGMGMAVAIFHILYENYKRPYHFDPKEHHNGETITLELSENVSFINKAGILNTLNKIPENSKLIIDASRNKIIDHDVKEIIDDFKENARHKNIELEIIKMGKNKTAKPMKKFVQAISKHQQQKIKV